MTPGPAFILRPAEERDRDAIADIWHASASLPGVGPAAMPDRGTMRQWVDEELADGWTVTVADGGGGIVGFVALKPARRVLDQLFVAPGALGAGVGRALLGCAMAAMPGGFTLFTRPGNGRACRFYERAGLSVAGEERHPRTAETVVRYRWAGTGGA